MIWWEAELVEASYRTRGTDGYSTEFNILSWINYANLCQSDFCICLWLMTFHGLWLPTVTIRNPALSCVTACTDFYQAPGPTELVAFHQPSFILAVAVPRFPPPRPAKLAPKLHQDLQKPQQPWFPDNQLSQKLKENAALAEWCPVLTSTNHIIHRSIPHLHFQIHT